MFTEVESLLERRLESAIAELEPVFSDPERAPFENLFSSSDFEPHYVHPETGERYEMQVVAGTPPEFIYAKGHVVGAASRAAGFLRTAYARVGARFTTSRRLKGAVGFAEGFGRAMVSGACTLTQGGRLTEERGPEGGVRRLAYDELGRIIEENDPEGHRERYEYTPRDALLVLVF